MKKTNYSQNTASNIFSLISSKTFALILALSYGGGLYTNIQHELEGAHEINELPPILHWLRDSTLAMVFIFFGVLTALAFARWLFQLGAERMTRPVQWILLIVILGIFTGTAFAVGIPIHGYIFGVESGSNTPVILDMLQDGYKIALVNMGISAIMLVLLGGLDILKR
jgi:hypothetical protein